MVRQVTIVSDVASSLLEAERRWGPEIPAEVLAELATALHLVALGRIEEAVDLAGIAAERIGE